MPPMSPSATPSAPRPARRTGSTRRTGSPRRRPDEDHALLQADPEAAARAARLQYVNDDDPGMSRRRAGTGFSYRDADGRPVKDAAALQRIRALAIPPAWTDVWICPHANGHIQATGRDARNRKQYRYHARWRAIRDESKYGRILDFAKALPRIRARIREDLSKRGLPRDKVLATIVSLLEATLIRVGNEEYERENRSYGLTTLRTRHVQVDGSRMRFEFRGKSGKRHEVDYSNRRLAGIVSRIQELPGQRLFQYIDDDGERQRIDSDDVNEYIREAAGGDFTAKDYRTWMGTVLAAQALQAVRDFDSETAAKHNVVQAIEEVARTLGNTPAVCRRCYIHPQVLGAYLEGSTIDVAVQRAGHELDDSDDLRPEEVAVLALLRKRLESATGTAARTADSAA
jgi:DNA topoisomerase-1